MIFSGTISLISTTLGWMVLSCPSVNAHGYLSFPTAVYRDPNTATSFLTTIAESVNPIIFGGKKWNDSPERNAAIFASAFQNSSHSSLDPFAPGCPNTQVGVPSVNVSRSSDVGWQNDKKYRGFVDSHHGPCEVWIDDRRALQNDDCQATFSTYPAHLPVDYNALCNGKCLPTFYWLTLHEPAWQVYKACTPIVNVNTSS